MRLHAPSTLLLLLGSLVFVVGAFLPVSRMYMLRTADERLALMQDRSAQWRTHLAMMGGGAVIAAGGMLLLPATLGSAKAAGPVLVAGATGAAAGGAAITVPAIIAGVAVAAGTLFWLRHLHLRVTAPEGFAQRTSPHWHFALYTLLIQVGLLALALAMFRVGVPTWVWLVPAAGTGLTVLAFVVFQDVPPFAHYVWLLPVAIGLLRASAFPSAVALQIPT
jgi:hypothetical protein